MKIDFVCMGFDICEVVLFEDNSLCRCAFFSKLCNKLFAVVYDGNAVQNVCKAYTNGAFCRNRCSVCGCYVCAFRIFCNNTYFQNCTVTRYGVCCIRHKKIHKAYVLFLCSIIGMCRGSNRICVQRQPVCLFKRRCGVHQYKHHYNSNCRNCQLLHYTHSFRNLQKILSP